MHTGDGEIGELAGRLFARGTVHGPGRRRAARRLAALRSPAAVRSLARAYVAGDDRQVTEIAAAALTGLGDPASVDAVCEVLIATADERLTALVDSAGHRHSDPERRAVQLFLSGNFAGYEKLDADGGALTSANVRTDEPLRDRLADRARAAGRVEWARTIVAAGGTLSDAEWDATTDILIAAGDEDELWRLAMRAPAQWGVRMLRELGRRGHRPEDDLIDLAQACSGDPAGGVLQDQPITHKEHRASFSAYGGVPALAVTPDGTVLASGGTDGRLNLWSLPSGRWRRSRQQPTPVRDLVVFGDGEFLASRGPRVVRLWRLPYGRPSGGLHEKMPDAYESNALTATPDGRVLAALTRREAYTWESPFEARLLEPATVIPQPGGGTTHQIAVTPDGRLLAVGIHGGPVRLWHLPSGEPAGALEGHRWGAHALAVDPAGTLLAVGEYDGVVRLWRLPRGEEAGVLACRGRRHGRDRTMSIAVTPDGRLLASACSCGTVGLWRLPSSELVAFLDHEAWVSHVAVTPDGDLLVSGGADGTVRLWRLPSGAPVRTLKPGDSSVTSLVVAPVGDVLAAGDCGGRVHIWRLWASELRTASRIPVGELDPAAMDELRESMRDRTADERAWASMIAALVGRRMSYGRPPPT